MSHSQRRKVHILSLLHICVVFGLASWWGVFLWRHSPARDVFRLHRPRPAHVVRAQGRTVPGQVEALAAAQAGRVVTATKVVVADVTYGLAVLVLFAVGSGVYVRRFEIWLQARSSGEAMSFRGDDLTDAALAANAMRRRGER